MNSISAPFKQAKYTGVKKRTLCKWCGKSRSNSCKKFGGFYLGSIGGPAAILATNNITKVEVLDFEDFGMEAVWKIDVKDFPAFIIVDDKGNDFFKIKLN